MFLIVGYVIILAASVGTYSVHGSLAALWVPMEYLAIVGLTIGGFVAGNDLDGQVGFMQSLELVEGAQGDAVVVRDVGRIHGAGGWVGA